MMIALVLPELRPTPLSYAQRITKSIYQRIFDSYSF